MSGSPLDALSSAKIDKSFAYTADLMAAILTWGGVGWLLDRALGTSPTCMVVGFLVGNLSGIYLLYLRATRAADREQAAKTAAAQEATTSTALQDATATTTTPSQRTTR